MERSNINKALVALLLTLTCAQAYGSSERENIAADEREQKVIEELTSNSDFEVPHYDGSNYKKSRKTLKRSLWYAEHYPEVYSPGEEPQTAPLLQEIDRKIKQHYGKDQETELTQEARQRICQAKLRHDYLLCLKHRTPYIGDYTCRKILQSGEHMIVLHNIWESLHNLVEQAKNDSIDNQGFKKKFETLRGRCGDLPREVPIWKWQKDLKKIYPEDTRNEIHESWQKYRNWEKSEREEEL